MTRWDTHDLPDLSARTFIVTGANSGLGAATTRALSAAGAQVIMACRDVAKAQALAGELGVKVRLQRLDLADLASIHEFAATVDGADVLINNAGVMAVPLQRTRDGFEMQIGTNHLGHFALTGLLYNAGKIGSRVVTVASMAHFGGRIDLDDLNWERRPYSRTQAYGQAKLANVLFARELQRRLSAVGSPVISVAAHPGYAATSLHLHTGSRLLQPVLSLGASLLAQSAEMGALPSLYAAAAPDVQPGGYYGPDGFRGFRGYPAPAPVAPAATDEVLARRLWELSEELTKVDFPGS
ncbi:oxidoreductase [Nocardia stercoris]|uniref:SDR family NAD(P)-dependent oxidoreductase n=1 Tax=Nocardia stercoris TaxID=2483361 RepID=A0A3M2KX74_9NOCA|nr:oxidoreductase [Nocardia stercoris]RMI29644.1 SDR family NAD(P)-dependent oxidoreductase [Nocardia stercoris]